MNLKFILSIPARLESSRLPNKVLADIDGKPMLLRVLEQCSKKIDKNKIVICTDNDKIINLAKNHWNYDFIKTSKDCNSGSERIASVIDELVKKAWVLSDQGNSDLYDEIYSKTLVINVQGDQPFLNPDVIETMIEKCSKMDTIPDVITPIYKLQKDNIHNSAVVKTLISHNERVIYFSRSALPHVRDQSVENWHEYAEYWGHVGIYGYRADILKKWFTYPKSKLEDLERLEQLKLIEAGCTFDTFKIDGDSLSIDTPEQLEEARSYSKKLRKNV